MKSERNYSEITDEIISLADIMTSYPAIDPDLYTKYDVKKGLRDINGNGVLTGLTRISEIKAKETINGVQVPCAGSLRYRGINVKDIIEACKVEDRFGFEETVYLLLFGSLPNKAQLDEFNDILAGYRSLPDSFVRDVIMKAPSKDMMNSLARGVLTMYSYDNNPDDTSIPNVLRQCLQLISIFPLLSVYGYQTYEYYHNSKSLFIHSPLPELTTAENILYMLRPDSSYTKLEAHVLDIALILHAEHGGGNNSTFTTRVVSSSGTDTYSAIAAALASLKGPKHGGANIMVIKMFEDLKANVKDWDDDEAITAYLQAILDKKAFDKKGLIYGIGHAIYSVSDPRAEAFKSFVGYLSEEKNMQKEYKLYTAVERLAPQVISSHRKMYKGVSVNVDFFSGFAYQMLGLPPELYTPLFAVARIAGWSAHRLEELLSGSKIIRPAYKSINTSVDYVTLNKR